LLDIFLTTSNPKKIIQLDASGKQGRYVRIQLLDKDYLSLAEVQVMGVDPLRGRQRHIDLNKSWYSHYQ
jgi:hypothetical protein